MSRTYRFDRIFIHIKTKQHFKGALLVLETKVVNLLMKKCTKLIFHQANKSITRIAIRFIFPRTQQASFSHSKYVFGFLKILSKSPLIYYPIVFKTKFLPRFI